MLGREGAVVNVIVRLPARRATVVRHRFQYPQVLMPDGHAEVMTCIQRGGLARV
jgi:hypothetical protein